MPAKKKQPKQKKTKKKQPKQKKTKARDHMKTMDLQGKKYVKVATRLVAIHEDVVSMGIETNYEEMNGGIVFEARIIITREKDACEEVYYGHSWGKLEKAKNFEKLETVAVGRALAFAGYIAEGDEIASEEEIQMLDDAPDFDDIPQEEVANAQKAINDAKTLNELKKVWAQLHRNVKGHPDVLDLKDARKVELEAEKEAIT